MPTSLQDLRYGLRMLAKNPGFTAVAVLTLALGIGANSAIFSVVNGVILRPLPYKDPDRLVLVLERIPQVGPTPIPASAPDVLDFARRNHVFENVAGFQDLSYELSGTGQPARIQAARVSAALFPMLGIEPLLGRTFASEEDLKGKLVAVISHSLWQGRFGGDPNVVGKTVALDRKPYTIIGVMPQSFVFPLKGTTYNESPASLWVPMAFTPQELAARGDNFNISVLARLKRGVTMKQAAADANLIAGQILETYPADVRGDLKLEAAVIPLREQVVSKVKTLMAILLGAVGLVLLIACVNVANLLLARAANRQKEIALRAALGAGRWRLLRQLISESVLLGIAGGGFGLIIAKWGVDALVSLSPGNIPRIEGVSLDSQVLAFTAALSLITGLVFGAAPAFSASKTDLAETLKEGSRSSSVGRSHHRLHAALVITEVAVALVLLVGAGLLIRSFDRVRETDPGFQPEHVLTLSVSLPQASYSQPTRVRSFYRDLLERIQRLPGVSSVGMSSDLPMLAGWSRTFTVEGYQPLARAPLNNCMHSVVYGDYFKTMGIPLVRGRYFTDEDRPGTTPAIIISKSIAERYFSGHDPIGKRLKWGLPQSNDPWLTIVGVVGDVKHGALDVETLPHTYEPYTQADDSQVMFLAGLNIALRTAGDPSALVSAAGAQIWGLDKQLAISDVQTMTDMIQQTMAPRRFDAFLMAVFAAAALLLAAVGLYGVISYSVTRRTHEMGVRMALGAERRDVVKLVVRQGLVLALLGVAIGLAGAFGVTQFISSLLYGVKATDVTTFSAASLLLIGVAFLASYLPARRATKVDPMVALRYE